MTSTLPSRNRTAPCALRAIAIGGLEPNAAISLDELRAIALVPAGAVVTSPTEHASDDTTASVASADDRAALLLDPRTTRRW